MRILSVPGRLKRESLPRGGKASLIDAPHQLKRESLTGSNVVAR